jgi:hypothetical protein
MRPPTEATAGGLVFERADMGNTSVLPGAASDDPAEAAAFPSPERESHNRPSLFPIGRFCHPKLVVWAVLSSFRP